MHWRLLITFEIINFIEINFSSFSSSHDIEGVMDIFANVSL